MSKIYIVLSQTGTLLSRFIKRITHDPYNHASIAFEPNLKSLYSFGRLNPRFVLPGGFVKESPDYGTFKRYKKTRIALYELEVSEELYQQIRAKVEDMYAHKSDYKYNVKGLMLAGFRKRRAKPKYFYCSEFVAYVLYIFHLVDDKFYYRVIKPMDFLDVVNISLVKECMMSDYADDRRKNHRNALLGGNCQN